MEMVAGRTFNDRQGNRYKKIIVSWQPRNKMWLRRKSDVQWKDEIVNPSGTTETRMKYATNKRKWKIWGNI